MYRLIYKSKNNRDTSKEVFRDILYTSLEFNRSNGITGALLASKSHYLQVLEGDFDAVNSTFFRIAKDQRHAKVELIMFGPAGRRLFEGWGMRGFGIFELNKELEKQLIEKYGEEEGTVRFPTEEWSCLSLVQDVNMMADNLENSA